MGCDVIIYAMKLSVEANIKTIKYIKAILNNWSKAGVKTLLQAQEENESHKSKTTVNEKEETAEEKKARKIKELEEAMEK